MTGARMLLISTSPTQLMEPFLVMQPTTLLVGVPHLLTSSYSEFFVGQVQIWKPGINPAQMLAKRSSRTRTSRSPSYTRRMLGNARRRSKYVVIPFSFDVMSSSLHCRGKRGIRKSTVRRKGREIKGLKRRRRRLGRNSRYVIILSLPTEHHSDSIAEEEWPRRVWIHLLS